MMGADGAMRESERDPRTKRSPFAGWGLGTETYCISLCVRVLSFELDGGAPQNLFGKKAYSSQTLRDEWPEQIPRPTCQRMLPQQLLLQP